jgi:MFS transporter, UMF1 family
MTDPPIVPTRRALTRPLWGWALYDFANSAYTTLIVTFLYSAFFLKGIAENETAGTVQWANAVAITAIVVALLSPLLGAIADQGGHRRRFLLVFTGITVLGSALLYFPTNGEVLFALSIFVVSNVSFEMANVFYNSYLPDLAEKSKIGRISGYGWALGYVGGLIAMGIALVSMVTDSPWFGLTTENAQNFRAIPVLVAIWYAVFSIPMFAWVKDAPSKPRPLTETVGAALRQLRSTFHDLKRYRQIVRLLIARMFYNDGIVTIFAFGAVYAVGTFGFSIEEVMLWGLALNVSAALGAFAMGFLDDRIGGKKTIQITNFFLAATVLFASVAQTKASMWGAGIFMGLFVGPNQSASRSLLARFVPESKETEFFGFFAFSGKAMAFMGPLMLGGMVELTGSQRYGVFSILLLFVIGGIILQKTDEEDGIRGATEVI